MTVRELVRKLSNMPENMQDMEVYTHCEDGYVLLQDNPHPVLQLGDIGGEQFCVVNGKCWPTSHHDERSGKCPKPSDLFNRIIVINL